MTTIEQRITALERNAANPLPTYSMSELRPQVTRDEWLELITMHPHDFTIENARQYLAAKTKGNA